LTICQTCGYVFFMRYLFGDLTEAPYQEDVLTLLQNVIEMGVESLKLQGEAIRVRQAIEQEKTRLAQALRDIEQFHQSLQKTIQTSFSNRPAGDAVVDIGQAVTSTLQQQTNDGKSRLKARAEEKIVALQARASQLAGATFETMRRFFMDSGLKIQSRSLVCELDNSAYQAYCELVDAAGISCSYTLNSNAVDFFSSPKRFSDLIAGKQEIPIGTKKAWRKKEPVPDLVRIDDASVVRVEEKPEIGEYRLNLKSGQGHVVVQIHRVANGGMKVFWIDNKGQMQPVAATLFQPEQKDLLLSFWTSLEESLRSLYDARTSLKAIHLENKDVIQEGLFSDVIHRLISYLVPIVQELDRHSLVPGELSLTQTGEQEGKREVFFVRKSALLEKIQQLPPLLQKHFAPLGLDQGKSSKSESVVVKPAIATSGQPNPQENKPNPAIRQVPDNPAIRPVGTERTVEVSPEVVQGVLVDPEDESNNPK